ncbi:terpene synthase family protein [Streptomyces phytophilus]|uniref:terpene synthase family protein n=1 Tax=Streptomyces phytophilus TaxID=722715 RepID=UPI0015F0E000|nr:terpene synthase family protein [Streptomyces phytophilus]
MLTSEHLRIPTGLPRHEDEERIKEDHFRWLVGTGLLDETQARRFIKSSGVIETISLMAPHSNYQHIGSVTNAASWHLLIREVVEAPDGLRLAEHADFVRTLVAAIDGRIPPSTQWHTAAILCTNALTATTSEQCARRHKLHWRKWLLTCIENARPDPGPPQFNDVLNRRHLPVAAVVIACAELLGGYELPQHITDLPELKRYRKLATDLCVLARDLLHLDQEVKTAPAHNTVVAYRTQHQCDWSDAAAHVLGVFHRHRHELRELTNHILSLPAATSLSLTDRINLRTYLRDLQRITYAVAAAHRPYRRHLGPFYTR